MKLLKTLVLTILLSSPGLHSNAAEQPQPSLDSLLAELMNHVDLGLMLRIQTAVMNNLDVIAPYSQEYLACLKAEGALSDDQAMDLKQLIARAKSSRQTCGVILDSMFGQMTFDITQEEFEQGLSPEYRELLQL